MKYIVAIVFAIFMMSATSTLVENPGFKIDETINGQFPRSFFIKGDLKHMYEDHGNITLRFDGNNNLLSISRTYYNYTFRINVTDTFDCSFAYFPLLTFWKLAKCLFLD